MSKFDLESLKLHLKSATKSIDTSIVHPLSPGKQNSLEKKKNLMKFFTYDPFDRDKNNHISKFLFKKDIEQAFQHFLDGKFNVEEFLNVKNFPILNSISQKERKVMKQVKIMTTPPPRKSLKFRTIYDVANHFADFQKEMNAVNDPFNPLKIKNQHLRLVHDLLKFKIKKRRMKSRQKNPETGSQSNLTDFKIFEKFSKIISDYAEKINNRDLLSNNLEQPYYYENVKKQIKPLKTTTVIKKIFTENKELSADFNQKDLQTLNNDLSKTKPSHSYSKVLMKNFEKKADIYLNLLKPPPPPPSQIGLSKPIKTFKLQKYSSLNNFSSLKKIKIPDEKLQKIRNNINGQTKIQKKNIHSLVTPKTQITESTQTITPIGNLFQTPKAKSYFLSANNTNTSLDKNNIDKKRINNYTDQSKYEIRDYSNSIHHTFNSKINGNLKSMITAEYFNMKDQNLQEYLKDFKVFEDRGNIDLDEKMQKTKLKGLEIERNLYLTDLTNFDPYDKNKNFKQPTQHPSIKSLYKDIQPLDNYSLVCSKQTNFKRKNNGKKVREKKNLVYDDIRLNKNFSDTNNAHESSSDDESIQSQTEGKLDILYKYSKELQKKSLIPPTRNKYYQKA